MTQISWQYQVNNRAGGYIVTNTDWNDVAGDLRAFIDQTTSSTTDNTPLPIGIDLANDRVYISDPDSTTPEDGNHADTTLSVVGTTTLAGNTQQTGTFTVGVDDTGYDVKLFGATSGAYLLWDESGDALTLVGADLVVDTDCLYVDASANKVGINTASPVLTGLTIGRVPSDANEGGQVNWEGGTSYSNDISIDRYGNDLRLLYNGSQVGTWSSTGKVTANGGIHTTGDVTVGVSDTGFDVKFWGDTAAKYMLWDTSEDRLDATGYIRAYATATYPVVIGVGNSAIPNGANIAIGTGALPVVTSDNNVAIGINALNDCTTSGSNVAIGNEALASTTTQSGASLYAQYNVAVGHEALYGYVHGSGNSVAVGFRAGKGATTGTGNTFIGFQAAQSATTGSNNTCLGFNAAPLASDTSNSITLGDSNVSTLRCQVQSISELSDERDKTDIVDLDMGLAFIQRLRPVRFVWDMREEDGKHGIVETGFIAQEIQQAQADEGKTIPNLISDENPDRLEAAIGTLIPALVRAIQELDDKVEALT